MKLVKIEIRNFRRLEKVCIDLHDRQTLLVGPNNSGKTSVSTALRCFTKTKQAFSFHDISLSQVMKFNSYNPENEERVLPEISLDLWFQFEADNVEFGRIFTLLDELSEDVNEVGIRCAYRVRNAERLWRAYREACPEPTEGEEQRQPLSYFLSLGNNFNTFYERCFFSLHENGSEKLAKKMDAVNGEKTLTSLLRVDFVDAQRDMSDNEIGRGRKLSSAFTYFYNKNLTQPEIDAAAKKLVSQNNQNLTEHYDKCFSEVMEMISGLGVPAAHDRKIRIVSNIEAETALRENSALMYVDATSKHELPEVYNGLGFKNLIFMTIQILSFHKEWVETEENKPLTHLIFIEEPEAHLHAQVQQTFIESIWILLNPNGVSKSLSQFAITTHSSHVVNSADFDQIRYFCRCTAECDVNQTTASLNASKVKNLQHFVPDPIEVGDEDLVATDDVRNFIKKYVTLPHCDLFFADGVIFIEGSVERILIPEMIQKVAPGLKSKFISILEVGGAYAHRFDGFMQFLNLPYVVITDLDSVISQEGKKRASACVASEPAAHTSNAAIKYYTKKKMISELKILNRENRTFAERCMISYQQPLKITAEQGELVLEARTLEEVFIYENLVDIQSGALLSKLSEKAKTDNLNEVIYKMVKNSNFKKTDFALDVISSADWQVPGYITEALVWLERRLEVLPGEATQ